MKRDWLIITLPTVIAAFILAIAAPVREAISQELDRRPCVNQGSPAGCVPLTRGPMQRNAVTSNPDAPGIVPVSEWPVARPTTMPENWTRAPDYLPKSGTESVTVESGPDEAAADAPPADDLTPTEESPE